ncbi:MAG: alkane 1-monooxygenase [Gammaproteobacteria bacterium]|nr:MAG: alkane 1-monooxygenase [Gammaproteobacteria bacterium]
MSAVKEYARYLIAAAMLSIGITGMLLGPNWAWLGLVGFVGIAVADFLAGPDHSHRTHVNAAVCDAILFLQLPLTWALWLSFAHLISLGTLTPITAVGAVLTVGFLTALGSLPSAHELMHRHDRFSLICASLYETIYGLPLNDLAHNHIHHPHVGTPKDGDTPVRGEWVYGFVPRSIISGTRDAIALEKQRLDKIGVGYWSLKSRFFWAVASLTTWVSIFLWVAGGVAGIPYLLATWTISFLILGGFNYTQHYGLVRDPESTLAPRHSWNHLNLYSRAVSFEISTHSEHHLDPDMPYQELPPHTEAPQMPSIVACFLLSFIPPLWEEKIAKPRLEQWDKEFANADEQRLAREANVAAGWPDWLAQS